MSHASLRMAQSVNGNGEAAAAFLTEAQNAKDFARDYGGDIRFNVNSGEFLFYQRGRFVEDKTGIVARQAKTFVRKLWQYAADPRDGVDRRAVIKFCTASESARGLEALLKLFRTEPRVSVTAEQLDADPWLLNVANGTVDLRTGEIRPHSREDLLTKQCPVRFDPRVTCPLWTACLDRWMDGNADLIGYLQRIAGLCLTGCNTVQELYFAYGGGANGKSVWLDTLMGILGDYGGPAPDGLLTVRATPEHACEIADLLGMRMVVASETEQGARMRVQLVKRLTGDSLLKARYMRQNYFTFPRTHKLIIASNSKPVIRETTHAIWRRVRLIPWNVTIPTAEQDTGLLDKLRAEWPGILAWAVRGCLDWQRNGMRTPGEVKVATENYRAEQDVLREFLAEKCVVKAEAFASRQSIYGAYLEWSKSIGDSHPLDRPAFNDQLRRLPGVTEGHKRVEGRPTRGWEGIGVATLADHVRAAEESASEEV